MPNPEWPGNCPCGAEKLTTRKRCEACRSNQKQMRADMKQARRTGDLTRCNAMQKQYRLLYGYPDVVSESFESSQVPDSTDFWWSVKAHFRR